MKNLHIGLNNLTLLHIGRPEIEKKVMVCIEVLKPYAIFPNKKNHRVNCKITFGNQFLGAETKKFFSGKMKL